MSLTAKSRSAILQGLSTVIPESEAVEEMLANFAARDADEGATKEFIRAEVSGLRSEMTSDISALRVELHTEIQKVILWTVGANVSMVALLFTLLRLTA